MFAPDGGCAHGGGCGLYFEGTSKGCSADGDAVSSVRNAPGVVPVSARSARVKVGLIAEAEICGEPGEVAFACGQPLHRASQAQSDPVVAQGQPGDAAEGAAEVVGGHPGCLCEVVQAEIGVLGQELAGLVDQLPGACPGGRPSRAGAVRRQRQEQPAGQGRGTLGQFEPVGSLPGAGDQHSVGHVDRR
jgi:hypothetical protein